MSTSRARHTSEVRAPGYRSTWQLQVALVLLQLSTQVVADPADAVQGSIRGQTSSYQCTYEDGSPERRFCIFDNLLLYHGRLTYVYTGSRPVLPAIVVHWNQDVYADIELQHHDSIASAILDAPATYVPEAVFMWVPWTFNYHHAFAEGLVGMFSSACSAFGHCNASTLPGPRLFRTEHKHSSTVWSRSLSGVWNASKCISPEGALHMNDSSISEQVIHVGRAAIGIGPANRAYGGQSGRMGFREVYQRPEPWIMEAFRHHIASCFGFPFATLKNDSRLNVTIVNRGDDVGRHFLNARMTIRRIWQNFPDDLAYVRVMRPDELALPDALAIMASSSIVIGTHGAATANLMFLPKGAVVMEYVWHTDMVREHQWAMQLLQDMRIPVSFFGLHSVDTRMGEWQREHFLFQEKWAELSTEERLVFYENGDLPDGKLDDLHRKNFLNFNLDWNVLEPALRKAVNALRSQQAVVSIQQPEDKVLPER